MTDWLAVLATQSNVGSFTLIVRAEERQAAEAAVWDWCTQQLYLQKPREVFRLVTLGRCGS
jgi:hypothetical protein